MAAVATISTRLEGNVKAVLDSLIGCLILTLAEAGYDEPCIATVMPGTTVAYDYCDNCTNGMAWVQLSDISPLFSTTAATVPSECATGWEATISMGMIRAAPMPVSDNLERLVLPDAAAHYEAAQRTLADMGLMHKALVCCALPGDVTAIPFSYTPVGPDGGCVGGVWQARVAVE